MAAIGSDNLHGLSNLSIRELKPLPLAVAGHMVGSLKGTVIVSGGSYWTEARERGGRKAFDDRVLALELDGSWREVMRLPQAMAYGGAASLRHTLVLAGGHDGHSALSSVWALRRSAMGEYGIDEWPDLPVPLVHFAIATVSGRIYVFGGQRGDEPMATNELWSLGFDAEESPESHWRAEPPLPGVGRILAAAASRGEELLILGGAALERDAMGPFVRRYLREAWKFDEHARWQLLRDLPAPSVGAPAITSADGELLLFGGDDGSCVSTGNGSGQQHPGFSRSILRLDRHGHGWTHAGELPIGLVTTGSALWKQDCIVIPGGENRPGSRSNRVLELHFS